MTRHGKKAGLPAFAAIRRGKPEPAADAFHLSFIIYHSSFIISPRPVSRV
jgi:hypothetical protein